MRSATEEYLIEFEEKLYVCIFKDFQTDRFGINFTASSEVYGTLLDNSTLMPNMGVGGCLNRDQIKELIKFLEDFLDERI